MTKQEFLENINAILPDGRKVNAVTDEEYKIVETVYCFHPSIADADGKEKIARLYADFGFTVIADMYPRAKAAESVERKRVHLSLLLAELDDDYRVVCTGSVSQLNDMFQED